MIEKVDYKKKLLQERMYLLELFAKQFELKRLLSKISKLEVSRKNYEKKVDERKSMILEKIQM